MSPQKVDSSVSESRRSSIVDKKALEVRTYKVEYGIPNIHYYYLIRQISSIIRYTLA